MDTLNSPSLGYISATHSNIIYEVTIHSLDTETLKVLNPLSPEEWDRFAPSGEFVVDFMTHSLRFPTLKTDGLHLIFSMPEAIFIHNHRQEGRIFYEDHAYCKILNPFDQKTTLKKRLIDLSAKGMALEIKRRSPLFMINGILKDVEIFIQSQSFGVKTAKVRHIQKMKPLKSPASYVVGFEFL